MQATQTIDASFTLQVPENGRLETKVDNDDNDAPYAPLDPNRFDIYRSNVRISDVGAVVNSIPVGTSRSSSVKLVISPASPPTCRDSFSIGCFL